MHSGSGYVLDCGIHINLLAAQMNVQIMDRIESIPFYRKLNRKERPDAMINTRLTQITVENIRYSSFFGESLRIGMSLIMYR